MNELKQKKPTKNLQATVLRAAASEKLSLCGLRMLPSFPSELLRSDFGFAALENLTPDGDGKPMPRQDKRADSGRILSIDGLDFLARILRRPEKSWKGRRFPSTRPNKFCYEAFASRTLIRRFFLLFNFCYGCSK